MYRDGFDELMLRAERKRKHKLIQIVMEARDQAEYEALKEGG